MAYLHAGKALYASTIRDHILKLCNNFGTDYVVLCRETSLTNFRIRIAKSKGYKSHRPKAKEKLKVYLPYLHDVFKWANLFLPATLFKGIENDDVFSLISYKYEQYKEQIYICGNDSDLLAIPANHFNIKKNNLVKVRLPGSINDNGKKIVATGIYNKWFKIIAGASKENYEGVKGLGPKRTYNLIKDCKDEEELKTVAIEAFYTTYGPELGKEKLEEGYSLCNLLKRNQSFVDPLVTNFTKYASLKLIW